MTWSKGKVAVVMGVAGLGGLLMVVTEGCHESKSGKPVVIEGIPKDWSIMSRGTDQWDWTNNTFVGHTTNGDSILASLQKYGDVTISGMLSTTNREASLALRMQDEGNGYIAVFAPDGTPAAGGGVRITLLRRKSGEERELVIFKRRKLSGPGQMEKITFTARGSRLEVFMNDVSVIRTNDSTFDSGFIGLRIYGDPNYPCDGVFSNLTVL